MAWTFGVLHQFQVLVMEYKTGFGGESCPQRHNQVL
jgi:hypothetical protein